MTTTCPVWPSQTQIKLDGGGFQPGGFQPAGIPGAWALAFDDEFAGASLDTTKWSYWTGANNNVTCSPANVIMLNPGVALQVASATSGGGIFTNAYTLPVGGCCEAQIWFPGPGAPTPGNTIYNWPAWWTSGPNWPNAGEIDIAESYNGTLTNNYHSPSGAHNGPSPGPAGNWSNSWHTYGAVRNASSIGYYFDGVLVHTYSPTDDNGAGQPLILLAGSGNTAAYGSAGQVMVNYVRAWAPVSGGTSGTGGNGTASLGPTGHGVVWTLGNISVRTAQTVSTGTCQCSIYVGDDASATNFVDGTFSGDTGDSTDAANGMQIRIGKKVWAAWSGGVPGDIATLTITGTMEVP